jgi:DNA-binding beta-propeller fold protein YncE
MQVPHSIAVDARGNVYVADGGNGRIQVFDNGLNLQAMYDGIGRPWALCVTRGSHQYLYSASNPDMTDTTKDVDPADPPAVIYKMELDGTIVGKVGGTENALGSIGTVHLMQCHEENELITTFFSDWVQIIKTLP